MKCRYCGKDTAKDYCSFECRKAYLDHFDEEDKYKERRKPLIIGSVVISIPFIILFCGAGVTLMGFLVGTVIFTHPFPPEAIKEKTTVKNAIIIMKLIGVAVIIVGIPFFLLTYTPFF